jgi:hypothetical protein
MARDFSEKCSICSNRAVDVRTEIYSYPVENADGGIRKMIIYRCKQHIEVSAEEIIAMKKRKIESQKSH